MENIQDIVLKIVGVLYGALFAVGKWYFSSLDKKLSKNAADIEHLKTRIALNDKSDEAVKQSIDELKSTMLVTQSTITEFIAKYSFVLDKLVEQEKKK